MADSHRYTGLSTGHLAWIHDPLNITALVAITSSRIRWGAFY